MNLPVVRRAEAGDAEAVAALFERADVPCFCQYYQFEGDSRAWQMQCAGDRGANRANLARDLSTGALTALVAQTDDRIDGWMRLDGPQNLSKLYQGRLYKGLPCLSGDRERVLAIACFLVDPNARRTGVARALLTAGLALASDLGMRAVEAFPRGAQDVTDEEQWMGPLSLYRAAGFVQVNDFAPYPVLRLELSS